MNDNCSSSAVSFHYIDPWNMLLMNYLLYNVTRYGVEEKYLELPKERPANHKYEYIRNANIWKPETTTIKSKTNQIVR